MVWGGGRCEIRFFGSHRVFKRLKNREYKEVMGRESRRGVWTRQTQGNTVRKECVTGGLPRTERVRAGGGWQRRGAPGWMDSEEERTGRRQGKAGFVGVRAVNPRSSGPMCSGHC